MKGIILAGGNGTRLLPLTLATSKHLLPIGDKPMIYYPLSTLMLLGIRQILIISKNQDQNAYYKLLGDGGHLGIKISYSCQDNPNGIPEAFIIGEDFIDNERCCLILGDNIFHGSKLFETFSENLIKSSGGIIFCQKVEQPEQYGVIDIEDNLIKKIEEKPEKPSSDLAITGLYIFDKQVTEIAKTLKKSERDEFEIVDLIKKYWNESNLLFSELDRGITWFDAGTPENLLAANNYITTIQNRQNLLIASIEEIAYRKGWISDEQFKQIILSFGNSQYARKLEKVVVKKND